MNIDLNNEEQLQALLRQLIAQKEQGGAGGHPGLSLAQDDDEENSEACVAQKCDPTLCVTALQQVFSKELSWVMFEYGSLILIPPNDDGTLFTEEQLRTRATELLEKYGKVVPGGALSDFSLSTFAPHGWMIQYPHSEEIVTFVSFEEKKTPSGPAEVGYYGRNKRHADWTSKAIVHVQVGKKE
jgi:hypothetical protein